MWSLRLVVFRPVGKLHLSVCVSPSNVRPVGLVFLVDADVPRVRT